MLIPALLCDRCRSTRHSRADIDYEADLLRDAVRHGWHVQNTVKDHTYGQAVCPHCRQADDRKDWA
jgi:hypothetical protein